MTHLSFLFWLRHGSQVEGGAVRDDDEARAVRAERLAQRAGGASAASAAPAAAPRVPLRIGGLTLEESGAAARKPSGAVVHLQDTLAPADDSKLEKKRRKEEKAAAAAYEAHREASRAAADGPAPVITRNAGGGGSRDVHLDRICVSNGGEDLISDATLTLAAGRRYGLVGRNGTGKTTFLRAFAARQLEGLPVTLSILHVEQEVHGDDTTALDCVLACDAERAALLAEEAALLAKGDDAACADALRRVYDRMTAIDAAGAPARAAAILAGLSFDPEAQEKATKAFSGGWRMARAPARSRLRALALTCPPLPPRSGWRWRGRCLCARMCCCWTSRRTTWTCTRCYGCRTIC